MKYRHSAVFFILLFFLFVGPFGHLSPVYAEPPSKKKPSKEKAAVRASIEKGLEWLVAQQRRDGSWGCDVEGPSDVTTTSIAVLTIMADGNTRTRGRYSTSVRKGIEYVMRRATRSKNDIGLSEATQTQKKMGVRIHTFFAAILLCEIQGMHDGPKAENRFGKVATRLVRHIAKSQQKDGSWNQGGWAPILSTTSAFLALRSARSIGIRFEKASLDNVLSYVNGTYDESNGIFNSGQGAGVPLYDNASALRILYGLGLANDLKARKATANMFEPSKSKGFGSNGGEEYLAWWFTTSSLLHEGGENWNKWYPLISKRLIGVQNKDGSWTGYHCITGRVFSTATALLSLQTPNRYLPMDNL